MGGLGYCSLKDSHFGSLVIKNLERSIKVTRPFPNLGDEIERQRQNVEDGMVIQTVGTDLCNLCRMNVSLIFRIPVGSRLSFSGVIKR